MNEIDVRSFILETPEAGPEEAKETAKKARSEVCYEIVLKDNCDLVIRRKTAKTSRLLVILISQRQFYVKDEKTGRIDMLSEENLRTFTTGLNNSFDIGNDFWLPEICSGKQWAENFMNEIRNPEKVTAISEKRHVFGGRLEGAPKDTISIWFAAEWAKRQNVPLTEAVRAGESNWYYPQCRDSVLGRFDYDIVSLFGEQFGIDNARKILSAYLDVDVKLIPSNLRYIIRVFSDNTDSYSVDDFKKCRNRRKFSPDKFIDYFIYQLVREGFANTPDTFWEYAADTYQTEISLYGKIKEKYPESLLSYHRQLSYAAELKEAEVNEEKWAAAAEREKEYEYRGEEYSIISPKDPTDMYDEARQQCNCLAGYVPRVIKGKCMIFFMRKNADPDRSLVTIEVYPDLTLGQVKARNNREPDRKYMEFVEEWQRKMLMKGGNSAAA